MIKNPATLNVMISFAKIPSILLQGLRATSRILKSIIYQKPFKIVSIALSAMFGLSALLLVLLWFFIVATPIIQDKYVSASNPPTISDSAIVMSSDYQKLKERKEKELRKLNTSYASLTPSKPYLVINTTQNHFYLYQNKSLIREGFCSSGSYIKLQSNDDREWTFKTPKGLRTIKGKTTRPVWRKPDWAFIEDGLPVPPADHSSRFESGVLGDYALSLGDGYLIHGTIYKRFLGMPVTHGCVRLADDDLEVIYNKLEIGSKVFIY